MSIERLMSIFVGSMVLLSLGLTWFVHPGFVWLSVFVGLNVIQQAVTGFCPAAMLLKKLGFSSEAEIALSTCPPISQDNADHNAAGA